MAKKVSSKKVKEVIQEAPKRYCLDFGCGSNLCSPEFIGVDIAKTEAATLVMDLEKYPWKIESNSVDAINMTHYFEHVSDPFKFMNECYRILKDEGQISIISPYYSSVRAFQDPTHKTAVSEMSFLYYNKEWRVANKLDHYPLSCNFNYTYGYSFHPNWATRSEEARNFALIHYINVVTDIQVLMTKIPE